jgi:hypothetical protein
MFCRGCKYPLARLQKHRCPECGVDFDPSDPESYLRSRYEDHDPWLRGIVTLLVGAVLTFAFLAIFFVFLPSLVMWMRI